MLRKKIIIVTGTGGILGTGHMQRMLNLAENLNLKDDFSASVIIAKNEFPVPEKSRGLITDTIPENTSLIIRDMRDSTSGEITGLRKYAPVLAIDDSGEGNATADFRITLLPVPAWRKEAVKPETSCFLYGHNFTDGIELLKGRNRFSKDIGLAVYLGFSPPDELVLKIRNSIPEHISATLLSRGRAVNLNGDLPVSGMSYAEIVSRTKIMITHFGLTMYEAAACGCLIAAVNPSEYHNSLTETVREDFNLIYLSDYNRFSAGELRGIISRKSADISETTISAADILKKVEAGTENFIDYIRTILPA